MFENQINFIKSKADISPKIAVVLGSGLGNFAENIKSKTIISYKDIEGMPVSTAPSHKGQFVFGYIDDIPVVIMQGRLHLYEGYSPQEVVIPIRILKGLGVEKLVLTNAAGGINKNFNVGDFMMISDHISLFVKSSLIGSNNDSLGERFTDMSNAYDKSLQKKIENIAKNNNIPLQKGVYVQLTGPQFETPAEIKLLKNLGADAVGMSTVVETIAANHCKIKTCAISLITNFACGILDQPLSEEEVIVAANNASKTFETLIKEIVKGI